MAYTDKHWHPLDNGIALVISISLIIAGIGLGTMTEYRSDAGAMRFCIIMGLVGFVGVISIGPDYVRYLRAKWCRPTDIPDQKE